MSSPFLGKFIKDLIDDFFVHSSRNEHRDEKLRLTFEHYDECGG